MTNISLGQTIDGSLSSTDTKNPKRLGSFSDDYTLTGISNWQQVQVNMDSTAIDSYLQLVNASTGEVIAFNDDSGGNRNSILSFTVVPGVNYAIRATSASSNQIGNYTFKTSSLGTASSIIATRDGKVGTVDGTAGNFAQIATSNLDFFDIALSNSGQLFGITSGNLYKIDPNLGSASLIGNFGLGFSVALNALEFANNILYSSDLSKLYKIDINTGTATLVADLGSEFDSSGDLVFDPANNRFLATSKDTTSDSLFSISLTGQATKIGKIGFTNVLGLSFENGNLIGFTEDRKRITISSTTGTGTFDKNLTGVSGSIGGASSIPSATPSPTPPTPTPPSPTPPTPTPPTVVTPTPTPPTVVTPPPLTIPISTQTSTVPPSQIPKPNSSGEVDLDPLKLKVINGQFTYNDKTKRYEASAPIQIGLKPTEGEAFKPLVTVKGSVSYDNRNIKAEGIVQPNIGNTTQTLFNGSFQINNDPNDPTKFNTFTSTLVEANPVANELTLAGANVFFKNLSFVNPSSGSTKDARIDLRGNLELPQKLGGFIVPSGNLILGDNGIFLREKFFLGPDPFNTDESDTDKSNTDKSNTDKSNTDKSNTGKSNTGKLFNLLEVKPKKLSVEFIKNPSQIIGLDTLKIQGELDVFLQTNSNITALKANLAGDNFIEISQQNGVQFKGEFSTSNFSVAGVPGLWEIKNPKLSIDTTENEVKGGATIVIPVGKDRRIEIDGEMGFKNNKLNLISLQANKLNIPFIGNTFLQRISGKTDNISDGKPQSFKAGLGLTGGPQVTYELPKWAGGDGFTGSLLGVDGNIEWDANRASISGTINFVDGRSLDGQVNGALIAGTGKLEKNWNQNFWKGELSANVAEGLVTGNLSFTAEDNNNVTASGKAELTIPGTPIFGPLANYQIGSANLYFQNRNDKTASNNFFAAWGNIKLPLLEFEAGLRINNDGTGGLIGPKEIASIPNATRRASANNFSQETVAERSSQLVLPSASDPTSDTFRIEAGTPWILLSAQWDTEASNIPIQITAPNGRIFTEADLANSNKIAIVKELTNSKQKVISVLNPEPGDWKVTLPEATNLGAVRFNTLAGTLAPSVQVATPSKDVSGQNVTINYNAIDADSTAKVSLFYDNDNKGFDGILIKDGLEEKDGAGNFVWNTQGLPTGDYYVYAMAMDENNAPVFSYAPLPIKVTESADLSVTKTADRDTAIPGSNLTYTVAVTNNGTDNAKGAILTETLPEGAKFVSANIAPTKQSGNELTFDLGDVPKGQISTVSITVSAPTTGNITSTSSITSKTYDPDISNDFDFASTTVTDDGTESTTNNVVATPTPTPPRPPLRQVLGTPENDNLVGIDAADSIAGFAGDDTLAGLGGDDIIYGNKGNDIITGNSGNDNIFGGRGNDLILGGADNDRLKGNEGDDTLSGDLGRDILIGGPGSDTFVLPKNAAVTGDFLPDAILDFQLGVDKIGLTEGLTQANLLLNFEEGNTIIKIAGSSQILGLVVGVSPSQLSGSFVSINLPVI